MFTSAFWLSTLERAVKTFAQTAVALFVAGAGLIDVDWLSVVSVAGLAALASVLTSVASSGVGDSSPSLVSNAKHAA